MTPEAERARYQREVEWITEARWREHWPSWRVREALAHAREQHMDQLGLHEARETRAGMVVVSICVVGLPTIVVAVTIALMVFA